MKPLINNVNKQEIKPAVLIIQSQSFGFIVAKEIEKGLLFIVDNNSMIIR